MLFFRFPGINNLAILGYFSETAISSIRLRLQGIRDSTLCISYSLNKLNRNRDLDHIVYENQQDTD